MLIVPDKLSRNALNVQKMGDPADTGLWLIEYMCERIGIESLADLDVLDLGCGVRFSQSIINRNVPIGTYTGLDVFKPIIDFLKENVTDPRLSYHRVNTVNQLYNPNGQPLDPEGPSPLGNAKFDVACMFSVITHQQPKEAIDIFKFLHRHLKHDGHLFFSAFIHDEDDDYKELDPAKPGLKSSYSLSFIKELLNRTNWSIVSFEDKGPRGLPIVASFHCRPTSTPF